MDSHLRDILLEEGVDEDTVSKVPYLEPAVYLQPTERYLTNEKLRKQRYTAYGDRNLSNVLSDCFRWHGPVNTWPPPPRFLIFFLRHTLSRLWISGFRHLGILRPGLT